MGFTYSGPLRVREALDGQAEFFGKWLPRVTEAEDVRWIWRTDFHRYMEWLERDRYDLVRAAEACEDWTRKQEAEEIVKALQQPAPLESCDQAEAIDRLLEQPESAVKDGAAAPVEATPAKPASSGNDAQNRTASPRGHKEHRDRRKAKGTERRRMFEAAMEDGSADGFAF